MKINTSCTKIMLVSLMLSSFCSLAALDLTSPPLQTGSSVEPNIMFMIDDSGSMHWEITPDLYADDPHYAVTDALALESAGMTLRPSRSTV